MGVIYADLERGALGLRGRIANSLGGVRVLRRTVERMERCERLNGITVFCPASQEEKIKELISERRAEVIGLKEQPPVNAYVRRRKWSLGSWRGGIHEATLFDEQSFTGEMIAQLREREVYSVVIVPAEAVLVDAKLLDGLIEHHQKHAEVMRFTFSQAAAGLNGWAFRLDMLSDLVATGGHIGDVLGYDPKNTHSDYITQECCFQVESAVRGNYFRYLADTQRNFSALGKLWSNGNGDISDWTAEQIIEKITAQYDNVDILPCELEIEINTEPSLRIKGYPHRWEDEQPPRQAMSLELFEKIVNDCADYDDICITMGGFGEPLQHPDLIGMIPAAKRAGIFGINIETDGRALTGELADALLESPVDVISVFLDANSAELYQRVKGQDGFDAVVEQVEKFVEKSKARGSSAPLVIPHLVKTRDTMEEMEAFYDRWLKTCGAAVITGYNDYAGQIDDRAVMDMAPLQRYPCSRPDRCLTIRADGSAAICSQDYQAEYTLGNVKDKSVKELWRSEAMDNLRQAQRRGSFDGNLLCAKCKEWHR